VRCEVFVVIGEEFQDSLSLLSVPVSFAVVSVPMESHLFLLCIGSSEKIAMPQRLLRLLPLPLWQ
jgi:hypothetical protein